MKLYVGCFLLLCSSLSLASQSITLSLASDYLFNGVSQTQENPALQASFDWSMENGVYAGIWGSNVDFNEGTDIEADFYAGYYTTLSEHLNLDVGIAQYTYHGAAPSSDYNYAELYAKFNFDNTNLNFWYTWDYFGTGATHTVLMLSQEFAITDSFSFVAGIDYSNSFDNKKWQWEENDSDYVHWRATVNYTWQDWTFSFGYEDTDLKTYGDATILLSLSHTLSI